ncbi:hypothetical protein CULC0102_1661 [Corynebacterium ulcerans 0102]|uniref:Transposase n=1 Tax=Corynebacterium ulcerans TaxID=65058 RepID=A0ABD7MQN1_CORUL|nr:Hypothetical protein Cul210931_1498 [Corynebacterium ulcerans]BAM27860.1 hypothetical protein CULC0102_1661 [Corynebacterium ulcerans 0102]SNV05702.1 Uncharacterised protein [Corynebacterium ulcerans]SQG50118.1 Uncharacterised protein [Corynebacterium ulcerans]SQH03725.1 Uncharacterised protein [Corynebacterium ulcerans]
MVGKVPMRLKIIFGGQKGLSRLVLQVKAQVVGGHTKVATPANALLLRCEIYLR